MVFNLRRVAEEYCYKTDCKDCVLRDKGWTHQINFDNFTCLQIAMASEHELCKAYELITREANKHKKIKIKYLRDVMPVGKISVGDWIDLRAAEDVELKAGEYKMIPLGVAMELPKGYEALVVPRSSTFRKYGVILANSVGVIDEAYCGDGDMWHFLAYAVRDTKIPKNERICQFRIMKHQPEIEFVEVETLGNADRGGIGSTGRR